MSLEDNISAPDASVPASALTQLHALLQNNVMPPPVQRDIAHLLAIALIEQMPERLPNNSKPLANAMVAALWPEDPSQTAERMATIKEKINLITTAQDKIHAAEILAKLGHMHQLAGLILRERELAFTTTPSTATAFITGNLSKGPGASYTTPADAVAALNVPRIELTFTAHPTNTNSQSGMLAQRDLGKALSVFRADATAETAVKAALRQYVAAPLLPEIQQKTGLPGRSVREETQTMLYHLNAVYDDLDSLYAGYDKALHHQFDSMTPPYDPSSLALNLGFHSWGSSADKDGNANINADTTLYAFAMHHQHMVQKYLNALHRIDDAALDGWKEHLVQANTGLSRITKTIEEKLNEHGHLSEAEHDDLRSQLICTTQALDAKKFSALLHHAYTAQTNPNEKGEILSLLRHVRVFGLSFGTLEYRETAQEFTRIISALIPSYEAADEATRQTLLNDVLADPEKMATLARSLNALGAGNEANPYSTKNIGPIAYHTRKRLELARDFPAAIHDHVLAECQHASNLLELLVLQHAVAQGDKKPTLGIIPLFEDREPILNAPHIVQQALENPHYLAHINAVQTAQGQANPAQQIQLAHSDNARRNGLPAARALIYQAHQNVRDVMKAVNSDQRDHPIAIQFYEGGSLTDSYRGGTRSISASINQFGLHDFSKMTAQGGDLLNYFNLPHSTYRVMMRNITRNAAHLKKQNGTVRFNEEKIIDALVHCSNDYKILFEGSDAPKLNSFLEAIEFAAEASAGNVSSRAGARGNGSNAVDATKVRTISFSESCQHAGLNPSWIGSLKLRDYMRKAGIKADDPEMLHQLYKHDSPLFKDVIDRIIFGVARTDMDYLRERSHHHPLMHELEAQYKAAFELAMEAYTGKSFDLLKATAGNALATPRQQHAFLMQEVYAHTQDVFTDQDRYMELVRAMRPTTNEINVLSDEQRNNIAMLRTVLHNAGDTVIHGRMPLLDDPTYAALYCQNRDIVRPHTPESNQRRVA